MKTNLAVIFGCRSVEHEVSIISAVQAIHSVDPNKYNVIPLYVAKNGEMYTGEHLKTIEEFKNMPALIKKSDRVTLVKEGENVVIKHLDNKLFNKKADILIDVVFPIVHGTNCEDGTIAGYLEFLNLPYIGCDILSAAVGMDKAVFKDVLAAANIPVLPCVKFSAREYSQNSQEIENKIIKAFDFPVIIKPINLGSSVGISKAENLEELRAAITLATSFADNILAEHAISDLREINCSVLGDGDNCEASVCEEPIMHDKILSYKDKYMGNSGSKGMASLGRELPANIPQEKSDEIRELSKKIFKAIGASGVVRIDYLLNSKTGEVFANEINTIPGSLSFYLWEATGIKYPELIDRLVELAFKRSRARQGLTFTINTNILSGVSFGTKGAKGSKF
ncbi:MAG: D-alanine--D-alanine ligase [Clostridia bacterium]|nr:D-alanine--D-alanine ligase [Clostridia bacterium]